MGVGNNRIPIVGPRDVFELVGREIQTIKHEVVNRKFENVDGFAKVVSLDEVKENDYNLNVTLYVFPEEKVEEIYMAKEWEALRKIEREIAGIEGPVFSAGNLK